MSVTMNIRYFELLDHWYWEATVNGNSAYGVEGTYEDAIDIAKDWLRDMLEGEDE